MPVPLAKALPFVAADPQDSLALRPMPCHEENGTALAEPGPEAGGFCRCCPGRGTGKDHGEDVSHGSEHLHPALAGVGDQDQPFQCDAEPCRRFDPEVGQPHYSAPGALQRRASQQGHGQGHGTLQGIHGSGPESSWQDCLKCRKHGQGMFPCAPALQEVDPGLQVLARRRAQGAGREIG